MFKVGSQLFTGEGPRAVRKLADLGFDIFLDLKFHDIPNTVAHAVAAAVRLPRLRLMTLHASGGLAMMRAAREAAGTKKNRPALLAVTVLTSFDEPALREIGIEGSLGSRVVALARLAKTAGMEVFFDLLNDEDFGHRRLEKGGGQGDEAEGAFGEY